MAITAYQYDHTNKLLLNKQLDFANLRVLQLKSTATFDRTQTTVDAVAGAVSGGHRPKELYGNGWTEGGEVLANVAVTQVALGGDGINNDAKLTATDVSKTATGGPLPPGEKVYAELLIDGTGMWPLVYYDLGGAAGAQQAGETTDYKTRWAAAGIINIQSAAPAVYPPA